MKNYTSIEKKIIIRQLKVKDAELCHSRKKVEVVAVDVELNLATTTTTTNNSLQHQAA